MKKKILTIALIAVCVSIAAYNTLAYFLYEGTATNVITAGDIKIQLQELKDLGGELTEFESGIPVHPGTEASKIVQIKNIGGQSAWVRIKLEKQIILADNKDIEVDLSLISYDINTYDWTFKDGYYYYNSALESGETTSPLFTEVAFSANMGNDYQGSEAFVKIYAEATQTVHNGQTALEAAGWPQFE